MTKPAKFNESTDFSAPGSDGAGSIVLTVPGAIAIPAGGSYTQEVVANIGTAGGALLRANASSNLDGRKFYGTTFFSNNISASGVNQYYVLYYIYRKNATQVALRCFIANNIFPLATLTTNNTPETITVNIRTLVAP